MAMRAFVVEGPGSAGVREVPEASPADDEVLIEVEAVGLCGTDVDLFDGTMPYLRSGLARYPLRPGHEWAGRVIACGSLVTRFAPGDPVTGDTFIGCGRCELCRSNRHHLCPDHAELGVRGAFAGALAERVVVPERAVHAVPATLPLTSAPLVEPASCSLRGVRLAQAGPGRSALVWGTGTLGLLAAQFAQVSGSDVTVVTRSERGRKLARELGIDQVVLQSDLSDRRFDAVIDATGSDDIPQAALGSTAAGGHLALLGVPPGTSALDTARIVLEDVTIFGVLGGSAFIPEAIQLMASRQIDVEPMISAIVSLDEVASVLAHRGRIDGTVGTKVLVRPSQGIDGLRAR